jgi:GAF domain-containing protein
MRPPIPPNEPARQAALDRLRILDTGPEADFDDIVGLASDLCGAPISLVSLVDSRRQWFKAKIGLDAEETERDVSFCAHAILGRDLLVVPNAAVDARFADNPAVQGASGIRFYAGAPLLTRDGTALGTLCVVDFDPHRLTLAQSRGLRALAHQVTEQLELRLMALTEDAGRVEETTPIDLAYLVDGRIRELRPIAEARDIAITLAVGGPCVVSADFQRLARALDYVIFTALKAAPPGGRVAARVSHLTGPTLDVGHSGGSIAPAWQRDLAGHQRADEPVPRAVAAILRAHEATVREVGEPLGSPDVRFQLRFPSR